MHETEIFIGIYIRKKNRTMCIHLNTTFHVTLNTNFENVIVKYVKLNVNIRIKKSRCKIYLGIEIKIEN